MHKIIAVANQKGGCGKSTTAVNFATGLAQTGYQTLLIDLDPQSHSTISVGANPRSHEYTIHDVLLNNRNIRDTIINTTVDNLYLVPANLKLSRGEMILTTQPFKESRLDKAIRNLDYDFIVIDCRPDLGTLTLNALYACNFILIPIDMGPFSLDGFGDLLQTIETVTSSEGINHEKKMRILLTMYDVREKNINEWILKQLQQHQDILLDTIIKRATDFKKAAAAKQPIFLAAPNSVAAECYEKLTQEFLNLCPQEKTSLTT